MAAASALLLLRTPITVAVTARLSTTSAVAAAQILPLSERKTANAPTGRPN
jgi:hypothetical protein